jgi:acyl carrier protein
METVANKLRNFVVENFLFGQSDAKFADDQTSFLGAGIIDSTGVLELVHFLEEQFAIKVLDQELVAENLDSIDNLVRFVSWKRGE